MGEQTAFGVLLMAHGTPASLGDLPTFLADIRRGRVPDDEEVKELAGRYELIGGLSPLAERTAFHAKALADALDARLPGGYAVAMGFRHSAPSIGDAVRELFEVREVRRVIGLVLAPQFSPLSIGVYEENARRAIDAWTASSGAAPEAGSVLAEGSVKEEVDFTMVPSWHLERGLGELWAERVASSIGELEGVQRVHVLFSAHSLPVAAAGGRGGYAVRVEETASLVASILSIARWGASPGTSLSPAVTWSVCWQSAGTSARAGREEWMGPDLKTALEEVSFRGYSGCVVCPVGFVSEHLEVLYDLDVDAAATARELGLRFTRCSMLDGDRRLGEVLADVVIKNMARAR